MSVSEKRPTVNIASETPQLKTDKTADSEMRMWIQQSKNGKFLLLSNINIFDQPFIMPVEVMKAIIDGQRNKAFFTYLKERSDPD